MNGHSTSELKRLSRSLLLGRYNSYTLPLILFFLADVASSFLPVTLFQGSSTSDVIFRFVFSFILSAFFGMLGIGVIRITRCVCKGEPSSVRDLGYAFKNSTDAFIKIQLLFAAIRSALSLLTIAISSIDSTYQLDTLEYFAVLYAVTIVAYFLNMLITIRLVWSVYYILDDPQLGAPEALKMSLTVTKGRTLKLIWIKITFVGMYILGVASFMTGFLYVRPYMEMTYMLCYLLMSGQPLPDFANEQPEKPENTGPSYWAGRN